MNRFSYHEGGKKPRVSHHTFHVKNQVLPQKLIPKSQLFNYQLPSALILSNNSCKGQFSNYGQTQTREARMVVIAI